MSELICINRGSRDFRWKLLSTVSAAALITSVAVASASDDTDRPTVWVELGGQLERLDSAQAILTPAFFDKASAAVLAPMVDAQLAPRSSFSGEMQLTFEPRNTDWLLSTSLRYGRSSAQRHLHYQSEHPDVHYTLFGVPKTAFPQAEFGDGQSQLKASHFILDFAAGKDVGLGMFGAGSSSIFSLGVRFAQFTSSLKAALHAEPLYGQGALKYKPGKYYLHSRFLSNNSASIEATRSTHGIGPSVSWAASIPIAGDNSNMGVTVDWGLNAAMLFGRQHSRVHHATSGAYFKGIGAGNYGKSAKISSYARGPFDHSRSRSVAIPNLGGFAGFSFRYSVAKLALGYRADFFFNAVDAGIDSAKSSRIGFYGPFATISVGLGG